MPALQLSEAGLRKALGREECEHEAIEARLTGGVPIGRVALERHALISGVFLENPWPAADERRVPSPRVIAGQNDGVVVVRTDQVGKPSGRRVELKSDRVVVDLLDVAFLQNTLEDRQCIRLLVGRIGNAVEAGDDVVGRQRLAVVELDALAQLERPKRRIGVWRPAERDPRFEFEVVVREGQVLAGLPQQEQRALIVGQDGVDRTLRGQHPDP